jgi:hypothetical protein
MNRLKKEGYRDYQTIESGLKPQGLSPECFSGWHSVLPWVQRFVVLDSGSRSTEGGRKEAQIPGRFRDVV